MAHTDKINELIDGYAETLRTECNRLLNSGGIDPDFYDPEVYGLAKIVLTAAIRRTANNCFPAHDGNAVREIKNLERF